MKANGLHLEVLHRQKMKICYRIERGPQDHRPGPGPQDPKICYRIESTATPTPMAKRKTTRRSAIELKGRASESIIIIERYIEDLL